MLNKEQLAELEKKVDALLEGETEAELIAWLKEHRRKKALLQAHVSGSLPPVQERDEDDLYCLNCGTTKLTYVEQYANGECWECRDCDWRTYRQGGNDR